MFQVRSEDLVVHAGHMDVIGDGLTTAQQAGQAVRMGGGAYGMLCQIVPNLLNGLQGLVVDGIGTAASAVHDTADAVRLVAADYDAVDSGAADGLRHPR